ncbi:MAG: hypothetical protein AAFR53_10210 [Pseudomonadota bacterium]
MTRYAPLALCLALLAPPALANNNFGALRIAATGDTFYDVRLVSTRAPGFVQIETLTGRVLGQTAVDAGPNSNVRVDFGTARVGRAPLVAKLIIDGKVVDAERIRINLTPDH